MTSKLLMLLLLLSTPVEAQVTSVAAAVPSDTMAVSGSPITASGTLTFSFIAQPAHKLWIGPNSGSDATPTWRLLTREDLWGLTPYFAGAELANGRLTNYNTITALAGAATPTEIVSTLTATDFGLHDYFTNTYAALLSSGLTNGDVRNTVELFEVNGSGSSSFGFTGRVQSLNTKIGAGYSQTGGHVGQLWLNDHSIQGPIAVQPDSLVGSTTVINNYYSGAPALFPSQGMAILTQKGAGAALDSTHQAANTYPVDIGLFVGGRSQVGSTPGVGFTTAIKLGGPAHTTPWNEDGTILGTGIDIEDYTTTAINLHGTRGGKDIAATGDSSFGRLGVGSVTAPAELIDVAGTDSAPAANLKLRRSSADTSAGGLLGYKSRGTLASPSQTVSGDVLLSVHGFGYQATGGFAASSSVSFNFVALENQTSTAHGGKMVINAAPVGGTTKAAVAAFQYDGVYVGSTAIAPANSGTRFVCIDTQGKLVSQTTACSGT